jgi:hypothetical protein
MAALPVTPTGEKPEVDSWQVINLGRKPEGGFVSK